MGFFRREETLNARLLREAGLDQRQSVSPSPEEPEPPALDDPETSDDPIGNTYGRGVRAFEFDVVTVLRAPGVAGDDVRFASLPDGDLIVDEEVGDADLSAFADAIERELKPPYRAVGRRQHEDLWA